MIQKEIRRDYDNGFTAFLAGPMNMNVAFLQKEFGIFAAIKSNQIIARGKRVAEFFDFVDFLQSFQDKVEVLEKEYIHILHKLFISGEKQIAYIKTGEKNIFAFNKSQAQLINLIDSKDVTFALGAAGTGKTFLAVAKAVEYLGQKKIKKIVISRPAVEAGEKIGFLPGDIADKLDPYVQPIYDCLHQTLGIAKTNFLIDKKVVEIIPLAFMRGRTFNDAFVILDEAQNAMLGQLKMILTRIGKNSKMVITGDPSQTDLEQKYRDGDLIEATRILKGIDEIGTLTFAASDVVRSRIVEKIIEAFENRQK